MMDTAFDILLAIHVALEPHRQGKRVPKDATMRPLIHPARLRRQQLESMIWFAQLRVHAISIEDESRIATGTNGIPGGNGSQET